MKKRILIADDHPIVRAGMIRIVDNAPDMMVAGEACDGQEVLTKASEKDYDLVVLDITMPNGNGLDVMKQLRVLKPALPILILSIHPEHEYAIRTLKAGAAGYLVKTSAQKELLNAIRRVLAGEKYISAHLAQEMANNLSAKNAERPHELLSDREYHVMLLLCQGKGIKEAALELNISSKTVSTYRKRIMEKMQMKTDVELFRYALENNLVSGS